MELVHKRKSNQKEWKAPSEDLYGLWGKKNKGIFGDIEIDKQVILPGVTWREEERLQHIRKYVTEQTQEECTLPQHIINDVYSMYVNEDFKRRDTNGTNAVKQKIIDKVYNSLTKDVTENSPLFSTMVTKELALYMQKVHREIEEEMEQQQEPGEGPAGDCDKGSGIDQGMPSMGKPGDEDGGDQGQAPAQEGEGDEDGQDMGADPGGKAPGDGTEQEGHGEAEDLDDDLSDEDQSNMDKIDDILDKNDQRLDEAMNKASKKMKDLEDKIGKENLQDLANSEPDFLEKMDSIKDALQNVAINKESIREVLAKILNESYNYFSKNFHTVEESLFDCEQCEDLFGLEFLNPIFRNAEIMSLGNSTRVYTGKIDLYLDCSGSMGSTETFEGKRIRMADLVKGIAMVLFRMNMIDKLYFFDSNIYEIERINEYTILAFNRSGGTNFDRVVQQAQHNGRNSVIITDGEDSVSEYAKNVFFVGVGGTQFGGYYGGEGEFSIYKAMGQCVTYESKGKSGKFKYVKS